MEKQNNNPGMALVTVMPPPTPTPRHPEDPGFKMGSSFGFDRMARQPRYAEPRHGFTTFRSHNGECILVLKEEGDVRIIDTGLDYSLVDRIERLVDELKG